MLVGSKTSAVLINFHAVVGVVLVPVREYFSKVRCILSCYATGCNSVAPGIVDASNAMKTRRRHESTFVCIQASVVGCAQSERVMVKAALQGLHDLQDRGGERAWAGVYDVCKGWQLADEVDQRLPPSVGDDCLVVVIKSPPFKIEIKAGLKVYIVVSCVFIRLESEVWGVVLGWLFVTRFDPLENEPLDVLQAVIAAEDPLVILDVVGQTVGVEGRQLDCSVQERTCNGVEVLVCLSKSGKAWGMRRIQQCRDTMDNLRWQTGQFLGPRVWCGRHVVVAVEIQLAGGCERVQLVVLVYPQAQRCRSEPEASPPRGSLGANTPELTALSKVVYLSSFQMSLKVYSIEYLSTEIPRYVTT